MSMRLSLGLLLAGGMMASPLEAQSALCTGNTAPTKQSATALTETATDNDMATGYHVYTQAITLTITANAIVLCAYVQTPPADMGSVGAYHKPYSDLQVQVPPGAWTPLSQFQQVLFSGSGSNPMVLTANVRVAVSGSDSPGQYAAMVVLNPYKK